MAETSIQINRTGIMKEDAMQKTEKMAPRIRYRVAVRLTG